MSVQTAMSLLNGNVTRLADSGYFRVLFPIAITTGLAVLGWAWSDIHIAQADLQRQITSLSSETRESIASAGNEGRAQFATLQSSIGAVQLSVTSLTAAFAVRVEGFMKDGEELRRRFDKMDDRIDALSRGGTR